MTEHRIVNPPELPEPSGFAHAVVAAPGRAVYLGGQTGAGETLADQFDTAATALVAALRAAGGEPDDLVSLVIFTTDMAKYRASSRELGEVWRRHFGRRYPAMALIGASALFEPDARVELMGVAVVPRMTEYRRLSEAQQELLERATELGHDVLAPLAEQGTPGRINRPLVRALGELGLLERVLPGEGEGSAVELCLLREGLAHGCTEAETALALQGLGGYPILRSARPEVREAWIPKLAAGEAVAAFALSEPEAGSDAAALALRADHDDGGYRLTGTKTWISNAPEADVYTVFARTTEDAGARGVTAFAVPRESEGLSGEALQLLSPHPIGRLELDGVFVGEEQVLGEVDKGFRVAMETLDLFRPSVGAFAVGMAQAALEAAVSHAARREAFGRRLSEFQAVAHQLAEVAMRVQAARLLVLDAAAAYDAGVRPVRQASAMAKLFATETAQHAVDVAIQVHGARALEQGHLLEHLYREVRAPRIYEGASEVQREIIARELFKETVV